MSEVEDFLAHYGVKGMRWHKVKAGGLYSKLKDVRNIDTSNQNLKSGPHVSDEEHKKIIKKRKRRTQAGQAKISSLLKSHGNHRMSHISV